ncbi:uracil-DNA glycosylase [Ruixingdingia sedimenti]|uniref:Uracil-DNA glycosylase n=1 Tax=Ruixingdingia sedimenti TaxID=3073604 RepID=A0ABU1F5J3_9RHOB|nr:uracil-DNA glycosylase [Xinfangfangia sp. LG-4]MDR5651883.1 uracil-DNA glycosylase [Xinfangfangia sp. LG-4]
MTPPAPWADLPFFADDWPTIRATLARTPGWLPGPDALFRALDLTPPEAVRAVILGQDPYPNRAHAMGLAFSVPPGTRPLPRSLANIFRELEDDTGIARSNGDLTGWAKQGVLLLNPVLSVPEGESHGHRTLGWQRLAAQILARCAARPTAFLLWGKPAQTLALPLLGPEHLILTSAHPSPLSARRGFFGSGPFSRTNHWLAARGGKPVDWSA